MKKRSPHPVDVRERLTVLLRAPRGEQELWPVQAEALYEALLQHKRGPGRTIVGRIGVGGGKTLICLLLPTVLPCRRPIYLVPARLREKTLRQLPAIRRHWRVRNDLLVYSYEEVSARPTMLADLEADLIVCDEAHALSRLQAARTRRVLRFAREKGADVLWPELSGTLTRRSVLDYAHLVELALRDGSFLPRRREELESWARVLDARGAAEASDWGTLRPLVQMWGEDLERKNRSAADRLSLYREAFERRVRSTPGVVTLSTMSCGASILIRRVDRVCPKEIVDAIREIQLTGELPGSSGASAIEDWQAARAKETLSQGFYYRWRWEDTKAGQPDKEWLNARRFWNSELSAYLAPGGQGEQDGVDTPGHVARLADSHSEWLPRVLIAAYWEWSRVRNRYRIAYLGENPGGGEEVIPVEPVWITDKIVDWMVDELRDGTILWYRHRAVAAALQEKGARVFFRGETPPRDGGPMCLSLSSHSEGHDLQAWGRVVFPCPPPNGAAIEQAIGRIHRPGQERDEIEIDLWIHTENLRDAVDSAMVDARYLHSTGNPQRLIVGTWI